MEEKPTGDIVFVRRGSLPAHLKQRQQQRFRPVVSWNMSLRGRTNFQDCPSFLQVQSLFDINHHCGLGKD